LDTTTPTTKTGISTRKLAEDVHAVTFGPEFLARLTKELSSKGTFTAYFHSLPTAATGNFSHRVYFDKSIAKKTA
jgi:hypothetical protein